MTPTLSTARPPGACAMKPSCLRCRMFSFSQENDKNLSSFEPVGLGKGKERVRFEHYVFKEHVSH